MMEDDFQLQWFTGPSDKNHRIDSRSIVKTSRYENQFLSLSHTAITPASVKFDSHQLRQK